MGALAGLSMEPEEVLNRITQIFCGWMGLWHGFISVLHPSSLNCSSLTLHQPLLAHLCNFCVPSSCSCALRAGRIGHTGDAPEPVTPEHRPFTSGLVACLERNSVDVFRVTTPSVRSLRWSMWVPCILDVRYTGDCTEKVMP